MRLIVAVFAFLLLTFSWCSAADANATEPLKSSKQSDLTMLVSYEDTPTKIYDNEVFIIRLKALLASDQLGNLKTTLNGIVGAKLLNPSYKWKIENDGTYSLSLFFKATAATIRLPDIETVFELNGKNIETVALEGRDTQTMQLPQTAGFCSVIAQKLKVVNYKMDRYDSNNNVLVLNIEAKLSNLEDFKLSGVSNQGINTLKSTLPDSKMFYYLTIPSAQTSFEFSYLNSEKMEMETVSLALDPEKLEDKVSTQTDINPRGKDRLLYVLAFGAVASLILAVLYYFKRNRFYLPLIAIVVVGCATYLLLPHDKVVLKKGCIVYVLPTENSTAFYQCDSDLAVEKIKEADGYIKIKMLDGKVGWAKESCAVVD